jgi:hypothetical protein
VLSAVCDSDPRLDAALENTSFTLMCFKHKVVADMICRKIVDRVLVAAVGDHFCPFASEKLEEIQHPDLIVYNGITDGSPFWEDLQRNERRRPIAQL